MIGKRKWIIILPVSILFIAITAILTFSLVFHGWKREVSTGGYALLAYHPESNSLWIAQVTPSRLIRLLLDDPAGEDRIVFVDPPSDGLTTDLCISREIWIISDQKLFQFDPEQNNWIEMQFDQFTDAYRCKAFPDGTLNVIGRINGEPVLLRDIEEEPYSVDLPPSPVDVAMDDANALWVLDFNGAVSQQNVDGRWEQRGTAGNSYDLYYSQPDTLWVTSLDENQVMNTGNTSTHLDLYQGLLDRLDRDLFFFSQTSDGTIWINQYNRLYRINGDEVDTIPLPVLNETAFSMQVVSIDSGYLVFFSMKDGVYSMRILQ